MMNRQPRPALAGEARGFTRPKRVARVPGHAPLAIAAIVSVAVAFLGCITIEVGTGRRGGLVETIVYGEAGAKIVLLEIDGPITLEESSNALLGLGRESTVARLREQLERAQRDEAVRGVLLRIDTPGGSATASDLIYDEIVRFKRQKNVPVVAHFLGMATSGGYYVAMAADEIVAEPTAITGSIGVIFLGVNVAGLMQEWGVEDQTITGGVHKDAGSYLRRMTPEERAIFQSVIDDLHARFRVVVGAGRPKLDRARIEELSDGRIYSAPQALANGLVDRIGSIHDSIDRLEERLGVTQSIVVSYHRATEWRRNLFTRTPTPAAPYAAAGALPDGLLRAIEPGFHYLWWPGLRAN